MLNALSRLKSTHCPEPDRDDFNIRDCFVCSWGEPMRWNSVGLDPAAGMFRGKSIRLKI